MGHWKGGAVWWMESGCVTLAQGPRWIENVQPLEHKMVQWLRKTMVILQKIKYRIIM